MDGKTYTKRITDRFNKRLKVSSKKSSDYATEDKLSNFKRVGNAIEVLRVRELPPELCYCFTLILLKLDRWVNLLLQNKEPENESIEDTVLDIENYIDLTEAVSEDIKK